MVQVLARSLIKQAVEQRISDIYFLPRGDGHEVYFRRGNDRDRVRELDNSQAIAMMSHFKFVAGMNVGENRRTQLGSCDYDLGEDSISLRLSTVGDYRGVESLVIRLLYNEVNKLNFWFDDISSFSEKISGRGLYLFSGPVGSGKTTLMYYLARKKFSNRQIITIEDPVEIKQEQMLQLQINEKIGATYNDLIKLSLRHRPDLLIIGEIRDSDTARAVIRASLTGATVFSTIHAKSIKGVYDRLLDLGVKKEELKNSLQGIFYQRLIAQGGLVDFENEKYETYTAERWNEKLSQMVAEGHISISEFKEEEIKCKSTD